MVNETFQVAFTGLIASQPRPNPAAWKRPAVALFGAAETVACSATAPADGRREPRQRQSTVQAVVRGETRQGIHDHGFETGPISTYVPTSVRGAIIGLIAQLLGRRNPVYGQGVASAVGSLLSD